MIGWLGGAYLWVKAAHVIATFFWIAGLFALPRYLVYQHATPPGSAEEALWSARCARLRRIILTPSVVAVWLLGLALAFNIGFAGNGWLHAKLTIVALLTGYHYWAVGVARKMSRGERPYAEKTLRVANEAPALATILAVILVIVRPF
ncbi:CopD family protein [Rhodoblastus sp.]|jgi:putative membrane protein|uniref:CopD family protein n=1 Tax=Rhodoblastus sp. TaxID=1962975 RepID=UPI002613E653|nr:CopD family protein [Rhodoblastus sp.]